MKSGKPTSLYMDVDAWISVKDNPRQRNTVRRSIYAKRKHLKKDAITQASVNAASLRGDLYKLDGHTRALLWQDHTLQRPHDNHVLVTVFPCSSIEEVMELYTHFDSRDAVETTVDQIEGACSQHNISLTSKMLSGGKWSLAIRMADSGVKSVKGDIYGIIERWKREIEEIDSWNLSYLTGALLTLAFLLVRKNIRNHKYFNDRPKEFFIRVSEDRGIHNDDKTFDGVYAITSHINNRRASKNMTGWDNLTEIVKFGYSAFKAFDESRMLKVLKPCDIKDLIELSEKQ